MSSIIWFRGLLTYLTPILKNLKLPYLRLSLQQAFNIYSSVLWSQRFLPRKSASDISSMFDVKFRQTGQAFPDSKCQATFDKKCQRVSENYLLQFGADPRNITVGPRKLQILTAFIKQNALSILPLSSHFSIQFRLTIFVNQGKLPANRCDTWRNSGSLKGA